MPCGQRCKEILDVGSHLKSNVECMQHTVHLNDTPPPAEMVDDFRAKAEAVAQAAQGIVAWYPK